MGRAMRVISHVLILGLCTLVCEASYPTECSAYSTCNGLQGNCCPNFAGVNLACCFTGSLLMDAAKADAEAKKVEAGADADTAKAKAAGAAAQTEAEKFKTEQEAAAKKAAQIQSQIDDLNENAHGAQKAANDAAAQATHDATVAV